MTSETCTRNTYQRCLRLGMLKRRVSLWMLLYETFGIFAFMSLFPFLSLVYSFVYRHSVLRAALVLCLSFCFSISLSVFFPFPLGLHGSMSLAGLAGLLYSRSFQLFTTALPLLVPFLTYRAVHSWILCLKNEHGPIFLLFLQSLWCAGCYKCRAC